MFGFDGKVLRTKRLNTVHVLENYFAPVSFKVCLLKIICPLGQFAGWITVMILGYDIGFSRV